MALKDMMDYITNDVQKEVNDKINNARVQATKTLIAYGESLDAQHEEKLAHVKSQLHKKEDTLKAEQDFIISSQKLKLENEFSNFLLEDIKQSLLEYTKFNPQEYQKTLYSWIEKTLNSLKNNHIDFTFNQNDHDIIQTITSKLSIQGALNFSTQISAGFIAQTKDGVIVDLSFETLFSERKQQLLNISMQILKENL